MFLVLNPVFNGPSADVCEMSLEKWHRCKAAEGVLLLMQEFGEMRVLDLLQYMEPL